MFHERTADLDFSSVHEPSTRRKMVAFAAAYAKIGTLTHAAEKSGVSYSSHKQWYARFPDVYPHLIEIAEECAADALEKAARQRASDGIDRPVFQGGRAVGKLREYSDSLLIFLLKGARPNRYRDNVSVTGAGGGPLRVDHYAYDVRDEATVDRLTDLLRARRPGEGHEAGKGAGVGAASGVGGNGVGHAGGNGKPS